MQLRSRSDSLQVQVGRPSSKTLSNNAECVHYPTTQNVLAIVDFGLRFTYVLAGWKDQLMTPLYSKMHCHVLMSLELKNKVVDKTHSISFWLVK
jgi:hypothetical protein